MSRRAATCGIGAFIIVYAAILLSCVWFGLPSRERLASVHGAPSFSDETLAEMTEAWRTIAASDSALRQVLDQDTLYAAPRVDERLERMRALRRMVLYTTEPDEMHVPMALGRMKPRALDFNPRFFQYGGLLFYGAALPIAAGGMFGLFPLSGGLDAFLRDPDAMGRLYVCGRLWIVLWTALMPLFAYRLARLFLPRSGALAAALLAAATPGFLAWGPVLKQVALASSAGILGIHLCARAARSSRPGPWLVAGAGLGLAGAAFVTHLALGAGLAAAWLLRFPDGFRDAALRAGAAVAGAAVVFLAWNPYWILDWRSVAADAAAAMAWYQPRLSADGAWRVLAVVPAAIGPVLAALAIPAALYLLGSSSHPPHGTPRKRLDPALVVVAVAALAVLGYYGWRMTGISDMGPIWSRQFVVLGPLAAVLVVCAAFRIAGTRGAWAAALLGALLVLPTNVAIVGNFLRDSGVASTRFEAGRWVAANVPAGSVIHVNQVVGPFSTPYFPLADYRVRVAARAEDIGPGEWLVAAGTANLYGSEALLAGLDPVLLIPSVQVPGAPSETFGFANGPIRIWRRPPVVP